MAIKKIRLTESQLTRLIKRIVEDTENDMIMNPEMGEGWLGDKLGRMGKGMENIGKGARRFVKGHGSDKERGDAENEFYKNLDEFENDMYEEGWENTFYKDEEGWEEAKERLIARAERNDFMGELKQDEHTSKTKPKYYSGDSGLGHMTKGAVRGAGSALRDKSFGTSSIGESRRYRRF